MACSKTFESGFLFLLFAEIGLGVGLTGAKGNLNKIMKKGNQASILSTAALVGRLSGLLSLMAMASVGHFMVGEYQCLHLIFMASSLLTLGFVILNIITLTINLNFSSVGYVQNI